MVAGLDWKSLEIFRNEDFEIFACKRLLYVDRYHHL
jgi:hypothetical protein